MKLEKSRMSGWVLCLGFCLGSGLWFLCRGDWLNGLICLGTCLLVSLPLGLERLGWRLAGWFFFFTMAYAMGPMLGKSFKLYYTTKWWDKLLHTSAGLVFAVLGVFLAERMNGGRELSLGLRVVFGICFSMAVSAAWELVEFGVDSFLGGDMQNDRLITTIHSYLLSDVPGEMVTIPDIRQVTVDGLTLEGYVDIGLIDTMGDVFVETLGALAYGIWLLVDRDRHPLIQKVR